MPKRLRVALAPTRSCPSTTRRSIRAGRRPRAMASWRRAGARRGRRSGRRRARGRPSAHGSSEGGAVLGDHQRRRRGSRGASRSSSRVSPAGSICQPMSVIGPTGARNAMPSLPGYAGVGRARRASPTTYVRRCSSSRRAGRSARLMIATSPSRMNARSAEPGHVARARRPGSAPRSSGSRKIRLCRPSTMPGGVAASAGVVRVGRAAPRPRFSVMPMLARAGRAQRPGAPARGRAAGGARPRRPPPGRLRPGRVHADGVAEERRAPRLVQRGPGAAPGRRGGRARSWA